MSVLRGERKPGRKWSRKDYVFAMALTAYEADLCKGCGQPLSRASGEHPTDYQIETVRCMGCAELEDHRTGEAKEEHGEKVFVVPDEGRD